MATRIRLLVRTAHPTIHTIIIISVIIIIYFIIIIIIIYNNSNIYIQQVALVTRCFLS